MKKFLTRPTLPTLAVVAIVLLAVLPPLRESAARAKAGVADTHVHDLRARNTNAYAQILGEVRMGASDLMFIKTERYLHNGIAYAPHEDEEVEDQRNLDVDSREAIEGGRDEHAHEEHDEVPESLGGLSDAALEHSIETSGADLGEHDHEYEGAHGAGNEPEHGAEEVRTVIRQADNDFRGFLGNLEREIKPWRAPEDGHKLTKGSEILPWYRLMTLSNPHYIRGWRMGAMWLALEKHHHEAIEFIEEGIAKNEGSPELFLLHLSLATSLVHLAQNGDEGKYDDAFEAARSGLAEGWRVRPTNGEVDKIKSGLLWTESHEEDFIFLARFVPMLLERDGKSGAALSEAEAALSRGVDDAVLERLVERLKRGESAHAGPPLPPR